MESSEIPKIHTDPTEVVKAFMVEMHLWEIASHKARRDASSSSDPSSYQPGVLEAMQRVFERYCTPKERNHGRLGSFTNPPEYQPLHEKIMDSKFESPLRACVTTIRETGFREHRMYILLKSWGRWFIDSAKTQDDEGRWTPAVL
jgi:hypothetical protein